jgi:hypothetical protein
MIHILTAFLVIVDGTSERQNCTEKNHIQWTYNAGVHMSGVAALWNLTETTGDTVRPLEHISNSRSLLTQQRRKQPDGESVCRASSTVQTSFSTPKEPQMS